MNILIDSGFSPRLVFTMKRHNTTVTTWQHIRNIPCTTALEVTQAWVQSCAAEQGVSYLLKIKINFTFTFYQLENTCV